MSTVQKTPQHHRSIGSQGEGLNSAQLRKDRISLIMVAVVFAAIIALMIWLASMAPPVNQSDFMFPLGP